MMIYVSNSHAGGAGASAWPRLDSAVNASFSAGAPPGVVHLPGEQRYRGSSPRTKNLGNYDSARSEIEIDLEPGDTVAGALSAARALVALDLGEMDGPTCAAEIRRLVKAGELSDRGLKGTGLL